MPKEKTKWGDHITVLKAYAAMYQEFPSIHAANQHFKSKGLHEVTRTQFNTIKQMIKNQPNFLQENTWYKPRTSLTVPPKQESQPIEESPREGLSVSKEKIALRRIGMDHKELARALDVIIECARLYGFENIDLSVKVIKIDREGVA